MTLTATDVKVSYNGDGSTVSFPVTFAFWDADDVRVVHTDAAGTNTEWTRGTQFNLPDGDGGTETLTVITTPTDYTPASGEKLTILSDLPNTQGTSLPLGGALPSTAIEQRLDQIVRLIQQRSEELDRTPKFGVSEASSSYGDMPSLADRASKFLAFDASGVPIAAAGTSADLTPVSAFIDTLLDDADAETARATLGVPDATETLENKTLTSPVINTPSGDLTVVLDRNTTASTLTNSTTETTVWSDTVAANTLGTTKKLRLHVVGTVANTSGSNVVFTFRVKYGATTVATIAPSVASGSAGFDRSAEVATTITSAAATNAQRAITKLALSAAGNSIFLGSNETTESVSTSYHFSVAEDSTAAKVLALTVQMGTATADANFKFISAHLELL